MGYAEDLFRKIAMVKDQGKSATSSVLDQVSQQNDLRRQQGEQDYSRLTEQVNSRAISQQDAANASIQQAKQDVIRRQQTMQQQQQMRRPLPNLSTQPSQAESLEFPGFPKPKPIPTPKPAAPIPTGTASQSRATPVGKPVGGSFGKFLNAIAKKESGGNYGAINADSGASGKYQIMPGNIPSWSKEALGKSVSVSQFRNSPQLQEAVARYKLKQYYDKYGAEGAAIAWYAGESAARRRAKTGRVSTKSQGKYPTISAYGRAIAKDS